LISNVTVGAFCYLEDRLNASGGCEATVTARTRIGWMKFREYGEILHGKRYSLKLKRKICRSCVRSAILCRSETWCLREKELSILRRTEKRATVRDKMAIASGVRWFGHVLRRDESDVLREALQFKVDGQRGRGRPRNTWNKQVKKEMQKAGLKREDAHN